MFSLTKILEQQITKAKEEQIELLSYLMITPKTSLMYAIYRLGFSIRGLKISILEEILKKLKKEN